MIGSATPQELALITKEAYMDMNSQFRQQTGEFWRPKMTRIKSMLLCSIVGAIMLIVGGGMYVVIDGIVQTDVVYYHETPTPYPAQIHVTIPKDMKAPIYVYYRIDNFFQNHRRYVISRDERQLRGLDIAASTLTCAPLKKFGDLRENRDRSFMRPGPDPTDPLQNDRVLYPCGLAAVTVFSDVLSACHTPAGGVISNCTNILSGANWSKDNIAYPSDQKKFINSDDFDPVTMTKSSPYNSSNTAGTLPVLGDPDLTVWMRHAATSTFHKLYRVITDLDLNEGDTLTITSTNTWDVAPFDGKKGIVLATQSTLGGKSFTLPICWMVVGGACLFEAVFVFILTRWCPGYTNTDGK